MAEYQPGVCNIGADERRIRRYAGTAAFVAAALYVVAVVGLSMPATALLGVFVPLFGGFVGLLQDRYRFCAGFGVLGRYDLSGSGGTAGSVDDAEAVRRDRRRAVTILAYAVAAAAAGTALVYVAGTL